MVYTEPTTRTTGDLITASIWNTDLVDDISFLNANLGILDAKVGYSKLASAAAFSFTNISGAYDDLIIKMLLRGSASATVEGLLVRLNNVSTGSYRRQRIIAVSTSITTSAATGQTSLFASSEVDANNVGAGEFGQHWIWIPGYSRTDNVKIAYYFSGFMRGTTGGVLEFLTGRLDTVTDAVTRIDILTATSGTFEAGSEVAIYAGQSI